MRLSVVVTALLSSAVSADPLLRTVRKDFVDLVGEKGALDLSCFRQVWNSDQADKDCPDKKDKAGGACVWCAGPEDLKMFAKAGACVTTGQISFMEDKGMKCGDKKDDDASKPGTDDSTMMEDFAKLGLDMEVPDVSCFRQVWNSETAAKDCPDKKSKAGGACQWCDASAAIKKYAEENPQIKDMMDKIPQAKEFVDKAGACVTDKQTSFLEKKGMSCGDAGEKKDDKKAPPTKPKIE